MRTGASGTLGVMLVLGVMVVTSAAGEGRPRCEPRNAKVLLSNAQVTVYGYGSRAEPELQVALRACTADGFDTSLGTSSGDYYRPPVMALSDRTVAFVTDGFLGLEISAIQVDRDGFRYTVPRPRERIGALRVRPDGRMAWVSCPLPAAQDDELVTSPRPNCVRAERSQNRVHLSSARGFLPARRIGRGRQLDPRSLRMSSRLVSWCQNGRRRHFTFRASANRPAPSVKRARRC